MMPPHEYEFGERLAMSQGVSVSCDIKDVLLENVPGAVNAFPAHQQNDRNGTDWWIEMSHGAFESVDVKVREQDWAATHPDEDDLALETFSVVENNVIGWTRNPEKKTGYVLWLWQDTGRWCLIPFRLLCKVYEKRWEQWRAQYKTSTQFTPRANGRGYHSECTFVPRKIVWGEIYKHYSGLLPNSRN